ncbi:MAG: WxL domain-containing protein [Thermomicrobiales bacterium]
MGPVTFSAVSGAYAADSADVTVKVSAPQGAVLSASITAGGFSDVECSVTQDKVSSGTLSVVANDPRGEGSGWNVTFKTGDKFTDTSDGSRSFSANAFKITNQSLTPGQNSSADGVSTQTPGAGSTATSPQKIMLAQQKSGMGSYTDTINADVTVPKGTLVGQYKTTVTVSITAGQ